jgi:urease accessory protein UreF
MREFRLTKSAPSMGRIAGKEAIVASELGGSQILTLLETLPGIANVLRSPVADALNNVIRAAARLSEFNVADAEELVRYATRRSLMGQEEGDRLLAEIQAAQQKRLERAADREKAQRAKARAKAKPVRSVKAVTAVKKVKVKQGAKARKR